MLRTLILSSILFFSATSFAQQRFVVLSDLKAADLGAWMSGKSDVVLELRAGDEIPAELVIAGDFIESKSNRASTILSVKKTLYVKKVNSQILFSLDGSNFRPFEEVLSGSLGASASAPSENQPVNHLQFELTIKQR